MDSINPEQYQHLSQVDHIYTNGDTELGGTESTIREEWKLVGDQDNRRLEFGSAEIIPAVKNIFLEVLANACDAVNRSKNSAQAPSFIAIEISGGAITVTNDGIPITVAKHPSGRWIPAMVMGMLRTSTNYQKDSNRRLAGKNGYGVKLTNIFSTVFRVRIQDAANRRYYEQIWRNNMKECSEPTIRENIIEKSFVQVSYLLDFARFGYKGEYPAVYLEIFRAYAAHTAFTTQIPVYFQNECFDFSGTKREDYVKLLEPDPGSEITRLTNSQCEIILAEKINRGCNLSFVNGILTKNGGVHVKAVLEAFRDHFIKEFNEKNELRRGMGIQFVKNHMIILVNCSLPNPSFSSQTKEELNAPVPTLPFNDSSWNSLRKRFTGLVRQINLEIRALQLRSLSKSDGKKKKHIKLAKLVDANRAGLADSDKCSLFIVEGKSAASYPDVLISTMQDPKFLGRDYYGIFPVKGKCINVCDKSPIRILKNKELQEIKQAIGIKEEVDYRNPASRKTLRYGRVIILTDADVDGKHISGLLINLFSQLWPSIVASGMIYLMRTPIIRVTKNSLKREFISELQYRDWAAQNNVSEWRHFYYKGLASSTDKDIIADAKEFNNRLVRVTLDNSWNSWLTLAFGRRNQMSDQRKSWVTSDPPELDISKPQESISEFISGELIHYHKYNLKRSIPGLDGLKNSQRKIMHYALNHLTREPVKTSVVAESTSKATNYHHGAVSLVNAIMVMSCAFVGSNNLAYFKQDGQFGTRQTGSGNGPAARYNKVGRAWWWKYVFRDEDKVILEYVVDEGKKCEPEIFLPIIPLFMVNGAIGMATGFATFIPNYNPLQLAEWIACYLQRLPRQPLTPWYRGFTGKIIIETRDRPAKSETREVSEETEESQEESQEENPTELLTKYGESEESTSAKSFLRFEGLFHKEAGHYRVTELPIGVTINNYIAFLEHLVETKVLRKFDNYCRSFKRKGTIDFVLYPRENSELTLKTLKLSSGFGLNSMTILDEFGRPRIFQSAESLLEYWVQWRLSKYRQRYNYMLREYFPQAKLQYQEKIRLIEEVQSGRLVIHGRPRKDVVEDLKRLGISAEILKNVRYDHTTAEGLADLRGKLNRIIAEERSFASCPPEGIWLRELKEFYDECLKYYSRS